MVRKKIKKIKVRKIKSKRKKRKLKEPPQPSKRKNFLRGILSIILIILVISAFIGFGIDFIKQKSEFKSKTTDEDFKMEFITKQPLFNSTQARTYLPAVDKNNNGIMTLLVVEAVPGSGRTLVDVDNLLFWDDTQHSIRVAKKVAASISGIDTNNYDIVYSIYANASLIGGESAGAAITIATISVLQNKTLRDDVVITGTVNHDGTIGPVQSILPKAKAAKQVNATIFLVPLLQGQEIVYETREYCERYGPTEFCTEENIPKKVNISEEAGVTVREVGTIEEALNYFFED